MAPETPASSGSGGGVDIGAINRNDLGVMIAGVVAFIASFLPYMHAAVHISGAPAVLNLGGGGSGSITAWHSYAILGLLLIFAAAAIIAIKTFAANVLPANLPVGLHVASVLLAGIGTLLVFIRALAYWDTKSEFGVKVTVHIGWGGYVLLIAGVLVTVFAALGMREAGEKVPWQQQTTPSAPPPAPTA
jgi:hypothetical protein